MTHDWCLWKKKNHCWILFSVIMENYWNSRRFFPNYNEVLQENWKCALTQVVNHLIGETRNNVTNPEDNGNFTTGFWLTIYVPLYYSLFLTKMVSSSITWVTARFHFSWRSSLKLWSNFLLFLIMTLFESRSFL